MPLPRPLVPATPMPIRLRLEEAATTPTPRPLVRRRPPHLLVQESTTAPIRLPLVRDHRHRHLVQATIIPQTLRPLERHPRHSVPATTMPTHLPSERHLLPHPLGATRCSKSHPSVAETQKRKARAGSLPKVSAERGRTVSTRTRPGDKTRALEGETKTREDSTREDFNLRIITTTTTKMAAAET